MMSGHKGLEEGSDGELAQVLPASPGLNQVKIAVLEAIHSAICVSHVVVEYYRDWEIYKGRGNGASRTQRHSRLYFHLTCFRYQPKKFVETSSRHGIPLNCANSTSLMTLFVK